MPVPANLNSIEVDITGGYFPGLPALSPGAQQTIRRASNAWLRPGGKIEVADGLLEVSSQNVGARLFAANIQRASIEGGLVGNRLPYAGLLRYQNACLFFLSEETDAQVYLDEVAVSGLTTSSTAGQLRIAVPDGLGGYNVYDAGFTRPDIVAPILNSGIVTPTAGVFGPIPMTGLIGVALARWRSKTDAVGPPSSIQYINIPPPEPSGSDGASISLITGTLATDPGQDGWFFCGTRWGDTGGELHVARRFYSFPRGTAATTFGSPTLIGTGTRWTEDLYIGDFISIETILYQILNVVSDTEVTLTTNYLGSTAPGKTLFIQVAAAAWYDSGLGDLVSQDVVKPPRAAGVLQYAGRVFLWGVPDTTDPNPTQPTGNLILATADGNPEHVTTDLAIPTASGSDLVNVLGVNADMYLMTTTGLEVVTFTGNPAEPYLIRVAAEPGFKAATNGVLYKTAFYGFTNRPLRTLSDGSIDVEFAEAVWDDMAAWNGERVIVAADPENEAVLYIYDNGSTTTVRPFMVQQGVWGGPINLAARILDAQVVNGVLYVTYLDGANTRVNQWEGGAGIGGDRYIATQYYDARALNRNRLKNLVATGKMGSVSVYAALPGAAVPDVSDLGAAAATFPLSDVDVTEPEIFTNIQGRAFAFRVDFASNDGSFDKLIARGTPISERR